VHRKHYLKTFKHVTLTLYTALLTLH